MSDPMGWVVLRISRWKGALTDEQDSPVPVLSCPGIGFLPVYATRDEAVEHAGGSTPRAGVFPLYEGNGRIGLGSRERRA